MAEPSQRGLRCGAGAIDVRGLAFECSCSRSDLQATGGTRRGACVASDASRQPAIRLRVPEVRIAFEDRIQGPQAQSLRDDVGDPVLRHADGLYAYQLAVVVDDAAQGISDIVRGSDLLNSTPRQIWLQQCLGLPTPRYAHLPVLLGADGQKLSKQNLAPAVSADDFRRWLPQIARWLGQSRSIPRRWMRCWRSSRGNGGSSPCPRRWRCRPRGSCLGMRANGTVKRGDAEERRKAKGMEHCRRCPVNWEWGRPMGETVRAAKSWQCVSFRSAR